MIERYFDAFNRHDIDGVMACFADDVVIIDTQGARLEGHDAVRRHYSEGFAAVPDGRCALEMMAAHDGRGVAESVFTGTLTNGHRIRAMGAEVMEFANGRIREIRDYHRPTT